MKKENKTFTAILKILHRLTGYTVLALFVLSLILSVLFIMGNFNGYEDVRQSALLHHIAFFSILVDFLCIFGIIESVLLLIFHKVKFVYFLIIFLQILLFAFSLTLLGFSGIVENLSGGLFLGLAYVM